MSYLRPLDLNLAFEHEADLLREAQEERRAREVTGVASRWLALASLFGWLGEQVDSLRRRLEVWAARRGTLASHENTYLDNPDPYRCCATC